MTETVLSHMPELNGRDLNEEENWNEILPSRKKRHQKRQQGVKNYDNYHHQKQVNNNATDSVMNNFKGNRSNKSGTVNNMKLTIPASTTPTIPSAPETNNSTATVINNNSPINQDSLVNIPVNVREHNWIDNKAEASAVPDQNVNPLDNQINVLATATTTTTTLVRVKEYESDFPSLGETAKMSIREIKEIVQKQECAKKQKPINKSNVNKLSNGGNGNNNINNKNFQETNGFQEKNNDGGHVVANQKSGPPPKNFHKPMHNKSGGGGGPPYRRYHRDYDSHYHNNKPRSSYEHNYNKSLHNGNFNVGSSSHGPLQEVNGQQASSSSPTTSSVLKYYESETMMYHATSVLTDGLFDMIYQEMQEEINNDRAQQYRFLTDSASINYDIYLSWFRTLFDIYRIINDVQDYSVFARHNFALPDYYISHLLQLTPEIVRDIVHYSKGEFCHDQNSQLVRRSMPLSLEERVLLHYNQLASDFDILRQDRLHVIRELLEYFLSPDGLPASDYIGRALVDSMSQGGPARIQIDQLTWHKKLVRLRVTPQEVHTALSNSSIVNIVDSFWVELVNPLTDLVIDSIRGPSPVHSIESNLSLHSNAYNSVGNDVLFYGAWRPPIADDVITQGGIILPLPPNQYYAMPSIYAFAESPDSQGFMPICADVNSQCVPFSQLAAPLPTSGNKSGTRTRNPSTFSALGDENTRPDDIFICINSDDESLDGCLSGAEGGNYYTGGTKRANISDRILAKHPAGDRHSAFTKSRTRNTKRGAKRVTKEEIDAALQFRGPVKPHFNWADVEDDDDDDDNDDSSVSAAQTERSGIGSGADLSVSSTSKVNVVDPETFKEYQKSASRTRSVSLDRQLHNSNISGPSPIKQIIANIIQDLNQTTLLNSEYTSAFPALIMAAPPGGMSIDESNSLCQITPPPPPPLMPIYVDPLSHLGYQQRINPLLPIYASLDFAHYIVALDQYVTPNHCLPRPDLLPAAAATAATTPTIAAAPQSVYYQPVEIVDNGYGLYAAATTPAPTAVIITPATPGREFTSALRQVKAADNIDASNKQTTQQLQLQHQQTISMSGSVEPSNLKQSRSRKTSQSISAVDPQSQSIHPLRMERTDGKSMTKLPEKAGGVFVFKPRPRTLSGSLLDNNSNNNLVANVVNGATAQLQQSRMSPHGRKLYYDELLAKGTKERAEKGSGKSQWMNLYYNVSRGILSQRFNRGIYETFKNYAIEDDQKGARYGIQCLFYFYSYYLETRFRNDLYMDFEHLVSEDVRNGYWYGFEKFWAFFFFSGKKPHALVKDSHLVQQLKLFNTKDKLRAQMEVPHAFRIAK